MGCVIVDRASDADLVAAASRVIADYGWSVTVSRLAQRLYGTVDFELSDRSSLRVTHYALVEAGVGKTVANEAEERARLRLRDFMSDAKAMSLVDALIAPEEPEGERLARFFATSAHEGHEAVRYERPVMPRPDDREWLLLDDNGRVVALFSRALCAVRGDWCAPMDHHWGSAVHSGWVYADDTHNPFLGVPDAIIDEVRGTLRSWTAMRAGQ